MRIGIYGLPSAGKTALLHQIDFLPVLAGSRLLRELDPGFDSRSGAEQQNLRERLARSLLERDAFVMDGHYAFGDTVAFTDADGLLYDAFCYLYIDPAILEARMAQSEKNRRYLTCDLRRWQETEMKALRAYCHRHNKDFYVLDNPPENRFSSLTEPLLFLRDIADGYSCVRFARECAAAILERVPDPEILLTDGDRTLTCQDSSAAVFSYRTHLFDGNFYTGYQAWRQDRDFQRLPAPPEEPPVSFSQKILDRLHPKAVILTTGHPEIWRRLSRTLGFPCFSGNQMSADTKFFIAKFLQEAGRTVTAWGDSLNDYFMLRQADYGYLAARPDGTVSRSLKGRDLGGITIV